MLIVAFAALIFGIVLWAILRNPFSYPYETIRFDVSGTRSPNMEDYIDKFLIENKTERIRSHLRQVSQWEIECKENIKGSFLKERRRRQFEETKDPNHEFNFVFTREKTRYKQRNYVRYPYKITETVSKFNCNAEFLMKRYHQLEQISFECTLSEYYAKNQRKLMTKELRAKIAERDHYTCQRCGKYMPDGVGLHIDHIIPIAKGGKSVPSNLQVLCSKCNGSKSDKTPEDC